MLYHLLFLILFGYFISITTAAKLGINGTYLGCELGYIDSVRIKSFPYNYITIPMIVGQLIALFAIYK